MAWVSFDVFRTLGFADTTQIKPAHFFRYKSQIAEADWVLFPEYWQVNALIYGLKARIFPSQASYLLGHNKIEMTRAFTCVAPEHVPHTEILANTEYHAERLWQDMAAPFVAKIPKSAQGVGVCLIEDSSDWHRYVASTDVLYVQEYLPIDRDIRVVIVGDQVVGAYWRLQSSNGFHNNISRGGVVDDSPVPEAATALALRLAKALEINHAGFDIAMVGGWPYVLEFNRLFGDQGIAGGGERLRATIFDYLVKHSAPRTPGFPRKGKRSRLPRAA